MEAQIALCCLLSSENDRRQPTTLVVYCVDTSFKNNLIRHLPQAQISGKAPKFGPNFSLLSLYCPSKAK